MPRLRDRAVCLRQWDWSETSQTLLLLTRQFGLLRGLAKGSRREGSSFCGGVEPLTVGEVHAIARPPGQLATITSWDLHQTCPAMRRSLRVYAYGMYLVEILSNALSEGDPHPVLFDGLVSLLGALDGTDADPARLVRYQWLALDDLGFRPQLQGDVADGGAALAQAPTYAFDAHLGGLTIDRPGTERRGLWRVRSETVVLIRSLADRSSDPGDTTQSGWSQRAILRANRLLAAYFAEILGRELLTVAMAFSAESAGEESPSQGDPRAR